MAGKILDFLEQVGKTLESKQVKVGFVDGVIHKHSDKTIAQIAFENEYGIPEKNQPPRPFFRNAISGHSTEWADTVSRGIRAGTPTDLLMEVVGAQIWGDVNQSITTLMEPALSPVTIALRRSRGNKSTKPLVDTGEMLDGLKHEVSDIESS